MPRPARPARRRRSRPSSTRTRAAPSPIVAHGGTQPRAPLPRARVCRSDGCSRSGRTTPRSRCSRPVRGAGRCAGSTRGRCYNSAAVTTETGSDGLDWRPSSHRRPTTWSALCAGCSSSTGEKRSPACAISRVLSSPSSLVLGLAAAPLGAQEQPKTGGVFKAAMIGEPPTLDLHTTTAVIVQQITWHIYEGALHLRQELQRRSRCWSRATPSATSGRTYTFKLRRGREVPQRQGDDLRRRGGLAQALGNDWPRRASSSGRTSRASRPRTRTRWRCT